ncbi:MAG: NAD+ synthase [Elusimicrobia bacterium]|nr:NAD+ synthase [Elusimicrobiota bacterium]
MKIALAQIDTTVGDIRGNLSRIRSAYARACALGADIVLFPELALPGYPSGDLLYQADFIRANLRALSVLAAGCGKAAMLVGYAEPNRSGSGKPLYNAAALLHRGRIAARRLKTLIPTYDVFDEGRYFEPAPSNAPVLFRGRRLGVTICEDAWNDRDFWSKPLYGKDPVARLAGQGAELMLNISASPYSRGKPELRLRMIRSHLRKAKRPFFYCNLVGGNDELVFDGSSLVLDRRGRVAARAKGFAEDLIVTDADAPGPGPGGSQPPAAGSAEEIHQALTLGLRDYARKCGFRDVLVGLSGGIDSALVCALAADALGPEHVMGVLMPSKYSSKGSVEDALKLSRNLGVKTLTIPIRTLHEAGMKTLAGAASLARGPRAGPERRECRARGALIAPGGLVEQNLQARIRGMILMALSNARGALLLSTGNKSESSLGYCTLYGDMAGGLSLISDVPKTTVYELARFINRCGERIPQASIDKAPSAELKPGQKDQDDLPPYEVLDDIMRAYVERGLGFEAIARRGHPRDTVSDVIKRIDLTEHKRRQAAPGIKITVKAFGVGRRMPIARGRHL